jgi:hypothetical protein
MLVERSTMHSVHRSGDALGTDAKDSMGPLVSHSSCTTVLHCRNCGAVSRGQTWWGRRCAPCEPRARRHHGLARSPE